MTYKEKDKHDGTTTRFKAITNLYITTNVDDEQRIREVFINFCASGTTARGLCEALGRVISIALQHDHRLASKIAQTLEGIQSETTYSNEKFGKATSIPDAISKVIRNDKEI